MRSTPNFLVWFHWYLWLLISLDAAWWLPLFLDEASWRRTLGGWFVRCSSETCHLWKFERCVAIKLLIWSIQEGKCWTQGKSKLDVAFTVFFLLCSHDVLMMPDDAWCLMMMSYDALYCHACCKNLAPWPAPPHERRKWLFGSVTNIIYALFWSYF